MQTSLDSFPVFFSSAWKHSGLFPRHITCEYPACIKAPCQTHLNHAQHRGTSSTPSGSKHEDSVQFSSVPSLDQLGHPKGHVDLLPCTRSLSWEQNYESAVQISSSFIFIRISSQSCLPSSELHHMGGTQVSLTAGNGGVSPSAHQYTSAFETAVTRATANIRCPFLSTSIPASN